MKICLNEWKDRVASSFVNEKKRWACELAVAVVMFAALAYCGFAELHFLPLGTFMFFGCLVFADMAHEDRLTGFVDVRKAAALACFFLAGCSAQFSDFAGLFLVFFALLRIFYVATSLCITLWMRNAREKAVPDDSDDEPAIPKNCTPFIPDFLCGVLLFLAMLVGFGNNIPFLSELAYAMDKIWMYMPLEFFLKLCGALVAVLAVLETSLWFVCRKYVQYIGLGLGDVFVLPSFAALFGSVYFTLAFAFSLVFVCISNIRALRKECN